ncbi:MAG TPA: glycoside hydrolase family 5 protein [Polyangiaceae bacterium]|nr:glycoside hydrolase family 5 protein [Polyangiaceae bacterium]
MHRLLPPRAYTLVSSIGIGLSGLILAASCREEAPACAAGSETCECLPNNTCQIGLTCLSQICVDLRTGKATGGRSGMGGQTSSAIAGTSTSGGQASSGGSSSSALPPTGNTGGVTSPSGMTGGSSNVAGSGGTQTGGTPNTGGGGSGGASGGSGGSGAMANTPVGRHGALSVSGTKLLDASGAQVKLEGVSSMWLNWDPTGYAENKDGMRYMRDNWSMRLFRAAMGVDAEGAYFADQNHAKSQVNTIVQNAIDLGIYVIIDWHDHNALDHKSEAITFFTEMAGKWGSYPNVIYEVFNEPLALDWNSQLKPYHEELVKAIRDKDPDNIIVLGTPNWDQDVDAAAQSPVSGKNLMYALHFYACSHQGPIMDKAKAAFDKGLPMFVTEWGATHADGGTDGVVCEQPTRDWHSWLDSKMISWAAWKFDGCGDSSCFFKNRDVPTNGNWKADQLNGHANLVIDLMRTGPGGEPSSSTPALGN